jgi:hypothetical protein
MKHEVNAGPGAATLSLEEFDEALAVHGSQLQRWPEELRSAAERLLEHSTTAQALLADAARLDRLLDEAPVFEPSARLAARVAQIPLAHPQRGFGAWWPFESVLRPAMAWAAAALVGLYVGTLLPADGGGSASVAAGEQAAGEQSVAVGADDGGELDEQDWDELSLLTSGYAFEPEAALEPEEP